jgi:hypothetical protein
MTTTLVSPRSARLTQQGTGAPRLRRDRRPPVDWTGFERGEGVSTYGSFRVSQRGAGANMSVDVNMDDFAYVRGDAVTLQGLYYVAPHSATINETISTADATNPRIDRVVLEIKDTTARRERLEPRADPRRHGHPDRRRDPRQPDGRGAVPSSALLLADVLVAATDTSISNAEIRDRRAFISPGTVPPLLTAVDMVALRAARSGGDRQRAHLRRPRPLQVAGRSTCPAGSPARPASAGSYVQGGTARPATT